jgi:hypothetical protein
MSTDLIIGLTVGIGGFLALAGIGYSMSKKTANENDYSDFTAVRESNAFAEDLRGAFNKGNKVNYTNPRINEGDEYDSIHGGKKHKKTRKVRKSKKSRK